jgi:hypothetical protein
MNSQKKLNYHRPIKDHRTLDTIMIPPELKNVLNFVKKFLHVHVKKSVLVGYNAVSTVVKEDGYNSIISQIFPLDKMLFIFQKVVEKEKLM